MNPGTTGQHQAFEAKRSQFQARAVSSMFDAVVCAASVLAAYLIRFEGAIPAKFYKQMLLLVPIVIVARVGANWAFGIYRMVWRYVGLRETLRFLQAVGLVSLVLLTCRLFLFRHSPYFLIPIGIIVIEGVFSFVGLAGSRFVPRILAERAAESQKRQGVRTLLVGAGQGGIAVAKEAFRHPKLNVYPVGFLDDDRSKAGMVIHGIPVRGRLADAERIVEEMRASQLIITSSAVPPKKILALMDQCRPHGVNVRIVPGLFEILDRKGGVALREVRIEDLLSRDPIGPSLSMGDLNEIYGGKRILVTGAGGSIGSELCRQLRMLEPESLLLLERDETNLFEVERELSSHNLNDVCVPLLVDVTEVRDLDRVFREHRPDVVFHAAAFKHVPMMERFPWEAVRNNVSGTRQLAEMAHEHGVESFVMISTDKAVNPTSVMGATKRFAEQIIQGMAPRSDTRFSCVRFGNVLGSRGSVVGIFRDQIEKGGPVTVTHPEATRYFMTIPEAANLVIQAGTLGNEGEIFLLDMGEPVRILDLARQMIHLSGYSEEEVPIKIVGTRPGEKLFEELRTDGENIAKTDLRKIFRCRPEAVDPARVKLILERLDFVVRAKDADGVRQCLAELEIGYGRESSSQPA